MTEILNLFDLDTGAARTIADQTYRQLRWDIVSGALEPSSKLAMEALTKRYGVGMSPLREALVKLTGDALVRAEGQRGFWVAPISIDELDDTLKMRMMIEAEALAKSITLGGTEWEQSIRDAYAALEVSETRLGSDDPLVKVEWARANDAFHRALVSACGSHWLIRIRDMLHQHSLRYQMVSLSNDNPERDVHEEHEAIAAAALSRNSLRACRLIEMHMERTADAVRTALLTQRQTKMSSK